MTTQKLEELKLDIKDLENVLQYAQRQRTKNLLTLEVKRLQTDISTKVVNCQSTAQMPASKPVSSVPKCYEVKINNHGWDQSDKYVKIYVPLKNVQTLPPESIICDYTDRSIHLRVLGLENKNHDLLINNLCEEIIPENCSFRIKTDSIVVSLAKKQHKSWSHMTEVEKRLMESKNAVSQIDKDEDPGASLMNMMKKMYQDGDDDMKRVIAKAWTESQEKRNQEMDIN